MASNQPRVPLFLALLDRVFPPNVNAYMSCDQQTRHEIVKAEHTMGRYLAELALTTKVSDLDILDFGCGWGGETLWLAGHARSVRGVDVDEKAIGHARKACETCEVQNCGFEWSSDGGLPFADKSFDAVLSTDTFEHVMDLDLAFGEIARVLKPGGSLLTRFGPLFRSPHGYHLYWACQVPYAHLIFGLDAIGAMRARRGGSLKQPTSWRDLGLNGRRFRDYVKSVERANFEVVRFEPIPVKGLKMLASLPLVGDLLIFGVDCHIRRPA
jgi:SAM-dependent methyltransferase